MLNCGYCVLKLVIAGYRQGWHFAMTICIFAEEAKKHVLYQYFRNRKTTKSK